MRLLNNFGQLKRKTTIFYKLKTKKKIASAEVKLWEFKSLYNIHLAIISKVQQGFQHHRQKFLILISDASRVFWAHQSYTKCQDQEPTLSYRPLPLIQSIINKKRSFE